MSWRFISYLKYSKTHERQKYKRHQPSTDYVLHVLGLLELVLLSVFESVVLVYRRIGNCCYEYNLDRIIMLLC